MSDEAIVKTFTLMMRKASASHEDFTARWLGVHAPTARGIPGLRDLVCLEIIPPPTPAPGAPPRRSHLPAPANPIEVDGVIECRMTARAFASPQARAWFSDLTGFVGAAMVGFAATGYCIMANGLYWLGAEPRLAPERPCPVGEPATNAREEAGSAA